MNREVVLRHEFVEFIPDKLSDGVVYVSIPYATVAHKCCCGCGVEVVIPLSPLTEEPSPLQLSQNGLEVAKLSAGDLSGYG